MKYQNTIYLYQKSYSYSLTTASCTTMHKRVEPKRNTTMHKRVEPKRNTTMHKRVEPKHNTTMHKRVEPKRNTNMHESNMVVSSKWTVIRTLCLFVFFPTAIDYKHSKIKIF